MTVREIQDYLEEMYGADVSPTLEVQRVFGRVAHTYNQNSEKTRVHVYLCSLQVEMPEPEE